MEPHFSNGYITPQIRIWIVNEHVQQCLEMVTRLFCLPPWR